MRNTPSRRSGPAWRCRCPCRDLRRSTRRLHGQPRWVERDRALADARPHQDTVGHARRGAGGHAVLTPGMNSRSRSPSVSWYWSGGRGCIARTSVDPSRAAAHSSRAPRGLVRAPRRAHHGRQRSGRCGGTWLPPYSAHVGEAARASARRCLCRRAAPAGAHRQRRGYRQREAQRAWPTLFLAVATSSGSADAAGTQRLHRRGGKRS